MRYLNTKRRRSYKREGWVMAFICIAFLLYVFVPAIVMGGAALVGRLSAPFFSMAENRFISPDEWKLLFSQKKELIKENRTLVSQVSLYQSKVLLVDELEAENRALHAKKTASTTMVLAHVVARGGEPVYSSITIDVGTDDGIKKGDFVLSESHYALGVVARVDPQSALVVLFSANGFTREVFVGKKNTLLTLKGVGGGNMIMEAPHEAGIIIGDAVINAEGKAYPLGVVEQVKYNPADPVEIIRLQHPVNIRDVRFVLIAPGV